LRLTTVSFPHLPLSGDTFIKLAKLPNLCALELDFGAIDINDVASRLPVSPFPKLCSLTAKPRSIEKASILMQTLSKLKLEFLCIRISPTLPENLTQLFDILSEAHKNITEISIDPDLFAPRVSISRFLTFQTLVPLLQLPRLEAICIETNHTISFNDLDIRRLADSWKGLRKLILQRQQAAGPLRVFGPVPLRAVGSVPSFAALLYLIKKCQHLEECDGPAFSVEDILQYDIPTMCLQQNRAIKKIQLTLPDQDISSRSNPSTSSAVSAKFMNPRAPTDPPEWQHQVMKTIDYVFPNLEQITDEHGDTTKWSSIMRGGRENN